MLHRAPSRRSAQARRKARYRERIRAGQMVIQVEIDAGLIDFLVDTRWLERRETYQRAEIGAAIVRLLADAARN